jgi:hypothetical protein
MKKIAMVVLFVLGLVELTFPLGVTLLFYAYDPQFRRIFDASKLTDQQRQLCEQFHAAMNARCQEVFYFGIVTIMLGAWLLVAERWAKGDAGRNENSAARRDIEPPGGER